VYEEHYQSSNKLNFQSTTR